MLSLTQIPRTYSPETDFTGFTTVLFVTLFLLYSSLMGLLPFVLTSLINPLEFFIFFPFTPVIKSPGRMPETLAGASRFPIPSFTFVTEITKTPSEIILTPQLSPDG